MGVGNLYKNLHLNLYIDVRLEVTMIKLCNEMTLHNKIEPLYNPVGYLGLPIFMKWVTELSADK